MKFNGEANMTLTTSTTLLFTPDSRQAYIIARLNLYNAAVLYHTIMP